MTRFWSRPGFSCRHNQHASEYPILSHYIFDEAALTRSVDAFAVLFNYYLVAVLMKSRYHLSCGSCVDTCCCSQRNIFGLEQENSAR